MEQSLYHLAVYFILRDYSDADHPVSAKTILDRLYVEYGISMGRKKLYRAIHALESIMDISTFTDNRKGYYLIERQLDKSEVLHLCHTVHATSALTPAQARNLEERLLSLLSSCQRNEFRGSVYLDNPKNTGSPEWLLNMDLLSEAISHRKWIAFDYVRCDINKNHVRRPCPYMREPRFIVSDSMHSYLIATDDRHKDATHFRIDKIRNLRILDKDVETFFEKNEAYEYASSRLFMFSGEPVMAEFICNRTENIFDIMIDEFGMNVRFIPLKDDPDHFLLRVKASYSGLVIFSQKYADILYPISPRQLVEDVAQRLSDAAERLRKILDK